MQKTIAIIRSVNERTLSACHAILSNDFPPTDLHVVNEMPFEAALRTTFQIGISSGAEWVMTVDADSLLLPGAGARLIHAALDYPVSCFQFEGLLFDKFTNRLRNVGHRLYRARYLAKALTHIPGDGEEIRPEYVTLKRMEGQGFRSVQLSLVLGIHDYEQFYRDIYRKAFVYANKHHGWLPDIIALCQRRAPEDTDFLVALHGLHDGLFSPVRPRIDARDYGVKANDVLVSLGLHEKALLNIGNVAAYLARTLPAGDPPMPDTDELRQGLFHRIRLAFDHTGLSGIAPYLVGAALSRAGAFLKRFGERCGHRRALP